MNKSVLVLLFGLVNSSFAMKDLNDSQLSEVSGQEGITIEFDSNIGVDKITYTDNDGAKGFSDAGSFSMSNFLLTGGFKGDLDVDSDGSLNWKLYDFNDVDIATKLFIGDQSLIDAEISDFTTTAGNSFTQLAIKNNASDITWEISALLTEDATASFSFKDDYDLATKFGVIQGDIKFVGTSGQAVGYKGLEIKPTSLTMDGSQLVIEFGGFVGGIYLDDIRINDVDKANPAMGTFGITDFTVDAGGTDSLRLFAHAGGGQGLDAQWNVNATLDSLYFQTDDHRFSLNGMTFNTNGNINGTFDIYETAADKGLDLVFSNINDVDFTIERLDVDDMTLGTPDANSFGGININNFSVNGGSGTVEFNLWAKRLVGDQGMRFDYSFADNTSFDFAYLDDGNQMGANVVLNNFDLASTLDITNEGLKLTIKNASADINLNNLGYMGAAAPRQGDFARVVVNNLTAAEGSYMLVSGK